MGKSVQLNRQWTFDQFVEDSGSQFPLSVARSIAESHPDTGYNPFLCWGTAGCGKSHLMHAIANHLSAHAPQKRFILTTGERFADNLFEAIRDKKLNLFRYLYHEMDVLMLDDADALMMRDWAQNELFETFNELSKRGRQLVLASRENLTTNPHCVGRLREVLQSGVIASFGEYSAEAKLAIISRNKGGIELPPELLTYLVRRCGERVSDLLAVLQQVSVLAINGNREITHKVVEDFIQICGIESEDDRPSPVSSAATQNGQSPSHRAGDRALQ